MKKIFTLAAAFMATALSFQAAADSWVVTTSAEFTAALGNLGRVRGAMDTIFVNPESADVIISSGTYKTVPTAGKFWVIGMPTDFRPIVQLRFDAADPTEPNSDLSMIFENLHLQYTGGNTASSGQLIYFNGKYADMDTLAFRNCEISNYPRTIYRSVTPKDADGNYTTAGTVNYFEMSDCLVHDANLANMNNNWAAIYFGQIPIEVVFRNNTFYDLPDIKAIFTMNYISDDNGRTSGYFTFENNTLLVAANSYDVISVGSYMGPGSEFHINNNLFLWPDWTDEYNLEQTRKPKILTSSEAVLVYAANNVIEGYDNWIAGNVKDADTGEYAWISADTTDNYTMATAELAWDDFYDRYNKDFSLLKSYNIYTAGEDIEGNPTYIGDGRWYLDEFPQKAAVNVSIEGGSTTATVTIQPEKAIYFVGDEISISIDLHDGLNTFMGWSDGVSTMNRDITLTGDLNLTAKVVSADYEMLWDFCQLKDGTTKNLTLPFAANHAANAENVGQLGIMTVEHSADGVTYADTTFAQTRNNKAYDYNGQDSTLFMAALLRSRLDSVTVDQEEAAAGYKEELTKACCANPDYYYIKFSTKGMTGVKVSAVLLAEARMHKTTKMEYSLDNATWNTLTTVTIDSVGDAWRDAIATLPAAAENQDAVYVRWIGDVDSPIVGPGMAGTDKDANGWPVSRKYYTYQFIGNIKVTAEAGGSAIEEAQAETAALVVAQSGDQVTVSNAEAATVEVYAANGALITSEAVVNGSATVTLPAHGVYYIKAGKDAKAVVY